MADLSGKKVAVLVDDYFEQVELTSPKEALEAVGANVAIISSKKEVHGLNHVDKGDTFAVDVLLEEADADAYDALVLPGGVVNADHLRMDETARSLLKSFVAAQKPVAVICHGPWLIISSGLAKGKKMTSYFTLQDDIRNAGGEWVDQEVVIDDGLITSRSPDDLPAFNNALIAALED